MHEIYKLRQMKKNYMAICEKKDNIKELAKSIEPIKKQIRSLAQEVSQEEDAYRKEWMGLTL